jgi:hypothetical protein
MTSAASSTAIFSSADKVLEIEGDADCRLYVFSVSAQDSVSCLAGAGGRGTGEGVS